MHSIALVAFAAAAAASSWSGQPIPACGWTTTLIYESDHTDTVPIPLASADCSSTMSTMVVPPPMPYTTSSTTPPMVTPPMMTPPPVAPPPMMSTMMCNEYSDGQPQCSMVPVSTMMCNEYSDGQPQCSMVPVCSEYSDGQPQCMTTAAPPPPPMAPTGVYPTGGYGTAGTGSYVMPTGTGVVPYGSTSIVPAIPGAAVTNGPVLGLLAAAGFAVALL